MSEPTKPTFIAEPPAEPVETPRDYRASRAEVMRELVRLVGGGLPVPREMYFHEDGDWRSLSLKFDASQGMEAWASVIGFALEEPVVYERDGVPHSWQYRGGGSWLGYNLDEALVIHRIPTGDELVEQPAEVPA